MMRFPYQALFYIICILAVFLLPFKPVKGQSLEKKAVNRSIHQLKSPLHDTTRIRLLMEIGKFHVFKPGELKVDLDSAERYLNMANKISDSLQLEYWQHQGRIMSVVVAMERGNEPHGRFLFDQAIHEFRRTRDREAEADLQFRFAVWLTTRGTYTNEVLEHFGQSAKLYHTLNKPSLEINVLKEIASIHFDDGKVDLAERELMDVLKKYKAIKYPQLHYTYNLLSTVSRVKGNFNKSLRYSMLSIQSMKQSGDSSSAANFYADLARIYMEIGNTEKGIAWYNWALQKWRLNQRASFGVFVAAGYVSEDMIRNGRAKEALAFTRQLAKDLPPISVIQRACFAQNLASCYNALRKYDLAEKYYLQSLQLYSSSNMDFEVSQEAQRSIARFYIERRSFNRAGGYLRKALKFNPPKLSAAALMDIHQMLFRVDSAQGNYLSAIDHQKKQKELNDSILDSRKTREIEELQIQYETEKRTNDLAALNNKSRLQQNKLEKANISQRYTLACIALLGIILALLYKQYKLKNRSNKDLQVQKEEISVKNTSLEKVLKDREWLLKEVHHRVKNNLQIVISLLNTQSSYLHDDSAKNALKESQHRMFSISLIHQKLYQSENLAFVNMREYIMDLTAYLKDSLNPSGSIRFQFDLFPVELDINQAIPVGLILNEAITNAIKHAFGNKKEGKVNVTFKENNDDTVSLEISDDGPGFPVEFNIQKSRSLGMNLIKGLSGQLDGAFSIRRTNGITILLIAFTPKHTVGRDKYYL